MKRKLLSSADSLTGKLGLFFSGVSLIIGLFCYLLITWALLWSEDRVNQRRITLDMQEAEQYFQSNPLHTEVRLDTLTTAYRDLDNAPALVRKYIGQRKYFLEEMNSDDEHDSIFIYFDNRPINGESTPIVVVSYIDSVEIGNKEFAVVLILVMFVIVSLIAAFSFLLYRLSKRMIAPIISIKQQLDAQKGDPRQTFSVSDDAVEEFKNLTTHLNKYREEIHFLLKREQAFARYASHELRTPLTVMKGASRLLSRGEQSDFQKRQVDRIQDSTNQMSTMVDALLSLVRYERNQADTEVRLLTQIEIQKCLDQHQPQADQKQIQFELHVEGEPETQATTAVISMLFGNLVRNAIAATPEGKVEVFLGHRILSVKDSGAGLSSEPNEDGHGLGLMIVDDLCHRYGWQFTLANNQNEPGCTATIHFETNES